MIRHGSMHMSSLHPKGAVHVSLSPKMRRAGEGDGDGGDEGNGNRDSDEEEDNDSSVLTTVAPATSSSTLPSSPYPHLGYQAATSASAIAAVTLSMVAASVAIAILALFIYWRHKSRRQHGAYLVPRPGSEVIPHDVFPWDNVQGYTTIGVEVIDTSLLKSEYYTLLDQIKGGSLPLDVKPYVEPHQHLPHLSAQMKECRVKRIRRNDIILQEAVHSGRFGLVHKALWQNYTDPSAVAVKVLERGASHQAKVSFFCEAVTLGQFTHPNIVRLFGLANEGGEVMMVLELLSKGNLKAHLATLRPDPGELCPAHTPEVLLQFCQQVALGMHCLSSRGFVHCDLAAMSILVSADSICKVANLGASLHHFSAKGRPTSEAPAVRVWEAPEMVRERNYSASGDVWSFGNLLYEVWGMGQKPFGEVDMAEVPGRINGGFRLAPPPGCPASIYSLMIQCWHPDILSRPQFSDIVDFLLLQSQAMLLKVPATDGPLPHPLAGVLGGPLSAGGHLYPDLQRTYLTDHQGLQ